MTTSHFILVHDDLTATQVSDLCDEINDVDGITQVVSLDSITGPGFDTSLVPDSVMEILQSGGYKLILANSSYKTGTDAINGQLDQMIRLIKAVDPEGVITGEGAMTKDLIEVADVDFKNVNVWSIMAVLVIIAVSFKSISIPALLVASISDISMIQWPCSFKYTLSSSSFFRSSLNHSSRIASRRKKLDLPAPWPPTRQSISSYLEPGKNTRRIAPSRKCFNISST